MRSEIIKLLIAVTSALLICGVTACRSVDDSRIPTMPVSINLSEPGMWNTYGVAGYGMYDYFIKELNTPAGFPFLDRTYTGYGGVLLIGGINPFTGEYSPLAYDLSCPVERKPNIRVQIKEDNYMARCPECGSVYNVTDAGGSPVEGPAKRENWGLTRYSCVPQGTTVITGYMIVN